MLKKIAFATITATALIAPPSLVHAVVALNAQSVNGLTLNGLTLNGLTLNGLTLNGVETAGREVYFVGGHASGDSGTVVTIELPQNHGAR